MKELIMSIIVTILVFILIAFVVFSTLDSYAIQEQQLDYCKQLGFDHYETRTISSGIGDLNSKHYIRCRLDYFDNGEIITSYTPWERFER